MTFNGANVGEQFDVSANGSRVRFTRDVGAIVMDLAGIEEIDLNALGGADRLTVNDVSGTDLTEIQTDLAGGQGVVDDGAADQVVVNGTARNDVITASGQRRQGQRDRARGHGGHHQRQRRRRTSWRSTVWPAMTRSSAPASPPTRSSSTPTEATATTSSTAARGTTRCSAAPATTSSTAAPARTSSTAAPATTSSSSKRDTQRGPPSRRPPAVAVMTFPTSRHDTVAPARARSGGRHRAGRLRRASQAHTATPRPRTTSLLRPRVIDVVDRATAIRRVEASLDPLLPPPHRSLGALSAARAFPPRPRSAQRARRGSDLRVLGLTVPIHRLGPAPIAGRPPSRRFFSCCGRRVTGECSAT